MLSIFDLILAVLLSGFIFYGLFFGLITVIGGILGSVFGVILASRYYLLTYDYLEKLFFGQESLGKIIAFIITFTIIRKIISLIISALNTAFNIISIIPFLTTINRLAGAILGFLEGTLILGIILFVASRYAIIESILGEWMVGSKIAPILIKITSILTPFLPEALKALKSLI